MEPATSAGRGRGWGRNNQNVSQPLRNPGNQSSYAVPEGDDWYDRISKLELDNHKSIKSPNSSIANLIPWPGSEEDHDHLIKIFQVALHDRTFTLKLIRTFENNTNSRATFMRALQKVYEMQDRLFKNNPVLFSNFVFLFSEVFHRLRGGSGFFSFLRLPLQIMYQKLLVLGDEDNIELALTQLAANGRELLEHDENPNNMGDILIYARKLLAKNGLSSRSRIMLLLMIDLHQNKFLPLTGNLQKFYDQELDQVTLSKLQRDNVVPLTISTPESQDNVVDNSALKPGILMTIPMIGCKPQRLVDTEFSPREDPSEQTTHSVPRAIRGSGFDVKAVYNERVNQAYGHDDRFSKDY